jgi:hypothetical protein
LLLKTSARAPSAKILPFLKNKSVYLWNNIRYSMRYKNYFCSQFCAKSLRLLVHNLKEKQQNGKIIKKSSWHVLTQGEAGVKLTRLLFHRLRPNNLKECVNCLDTWLLAITM